MRAARNVARKGRPFPYGEIRFSPAAEFRPANTLERELRAGRPCLVLGKTEFH